MKERNNFKYICSSFFFFFYCLTEVASHDTWWISKPEFGSSPKSLTLSEGETAKLHCVVHNLNDRSVTWMRKRDLHILTVGHVTYSADDRFEVIHAPRSNEWTLLIKYVQPRDSGKYECQVNTDPQMSRTVTISVLDSNLKSAISKTKVFVANNTASTKDGNLRVEIIGARERFIEEGSKLTLTCLITSNGGPLSVVYWYHGSTLIDYNSPRGGVKLKTENGHTTATLLISSIGPGDTGMYSCVPTGSHPATVVVHVQKEEQKAANLQIGVKNSTKSKASSTHQHLLITLTCNWNFLCYILITIFGLRI